MIAMLYEWLQANRFTVYLTITLYFFVLWGVKIVLSSFYRPWVNNFTKPVSVIVPVYHEDRTVLKKVIQQILLQPPELVQQILIITDFREPDLKNWLKLNIELDPRVTILETEVAGKRNSLRLGIEATYSEIIVSIESDVFIKEDSISELIKPFQNDRVGGVVGDQEVYQPKHNLWTWLEFLVEKTKYTLIYPALGAFHQVAVLSGRTVAYRRKAVLPLLDQLTHEYFWGRHCISGDDGRLTSLLLEAGWKTEFQSTSVIETLSPRTFYGIAKQKVRWNRNSCRRTLRALFWDRLWVWRRYPLLTAQMLIFWINMGVCGALVFIFIRSLIYGHFFWFGTDWFDIFLRVLILIIGLTLTRSIRIFFILKRVRIARPGWRWGALFLLPGYLLLLWFLKLIAILTLNKQGWVTRKLQSKGGF